jgi:hypothetical protein
MSDPVKVPLPLRERGFCSLALSTGYSQWFHSPPDAALPA